LTISTFSLGKSQRTLPFGFIRAKYQPFMPVQTNQIAALHGIINRKERDFIGKMPS